MSPEVLKEVTFPSWPQVNQAETKRQLYLLSCLPRKFKTAAGLSRSFGETADRESVASQGLCGQDKVISLRMYINTYPEMGKQMRTQKSQEAPAQTGEGERASSYPLASAGAG